MMCASRELSKPQQQQDNKHSHSVVLCCGVVFGFRRNANYTADSSRAQRIKSCAHVIRWENMCSAQLRVVKMDEERTEEETTTTAANR